MSIRLSLLLAAAIAVAGVDIRPCLAQVSATATIKARVHNAPRPRRPGHAATAAELQVASLTLGPGSSRAQLLTPMGEPITLELEGTTATTRVRLLVSDFEARTDSPPIECRWRIVDAAPPQQPNQPAQVTCHELLIRWADTETWPARLSIGRSVSADKLHTGQFVAHFTILAEY